MKLSSIVCIAAIFIVQSCSKKTNTTPIIPTVKKINFIFKFDSTQIRLDGFGNPTTMPAGHAGESPRFNLMSAHYVELAPNQFTALGSGDVLYHAPEVTTGGLNAIDFTKAHAVGNNKVFLSVPIDSVTPGTYNSLAYQNYNVHVNSGGYRIDGTLASFIGFRTYLSSYKVKDSTVTVNSNKSQGYWAYEGKIPGYGFVSQGQAPAGATTVPNPLAATSPIPAGSCVVTGQFQTPLTVTGSETGDINISVSLSTNKSFEWTDNDGNGQYDPSLGNQVVDMGIRGMIPKKL